MKKLLLLLIIAFLPFSNNAEASIVPVLKDCEVNLEEKTNQKFGLCEGDVLAVITYVAFNEIIDTAKPEFLVNGIKEAVPENARIKYSAYSKAGGDIVIIVQSLLNILLPILSMFIFLSALKCIADMSAGVYNTEGDGIKGALISKGGLRLLFLFLTSMSLFSFSSNIVPPIFLIILFFATIGFATSSYMIATIIAVFSFTPTASNINNTATLNSAKAFSNSLIQIALTEERTNRALMQLHYNKWNEDIEEGFVDSLVEGGSRLFGSDDESNYFTDEMSFTNAQFQIDGCFGAKAMANKDGNELEGEIKSYTIQTLDECYFDKSISIEDEGEVMNGVGFNENKFGKPSAIATIQYTDFSLQDIEDENVRVNDLDSDALEKVVDYIDKSSLSVVNRYRHMNTALSYVNKIETIASKDYDEKELFESIDSGVVQDLKEDIKNTIQTELKQFQQITKGYEYETRKPLEDLFINTLAGKVVKAFEGGYGAGDFYFEGNNTSSNIKYLTQDYAKEIADYLISAQCYNDIAYYSKIAYMNRKLYIDNEEGWKRFKDDVDTKDFACLSTNIVNNGNITVDIKGREILGDRGSIKNFFNENAQMIPGARDLAKELELELYNKALEKRVSMSLYLYTVRYASQLALAEVATENVDNDIYNEIRKKNIFAVVDIAMKLGSMTSSTENFIKDMPYISTAGIASGTFTTGNFNYINFNVFEQDISTSIPIRFDELKLLDFFSMNNDMSSKVNRRNTLITESEADSFAYIDFEKEIRDTITGSISSINLLWTSDKNRDLTNILSECYDPDNGIACVGEHPVVVLPVLGDEMINLGIKIRALKIGFSAINGAVDDVKELVEKKGDQAGGSTGKKIAKWGAKIGGFFIKAFTASIAMLVEMLDTLTPFLMLGGILMKVGIPALLVWTVIVPILNSLVAIATSFVAIPILILSTALGFKDEKEFFSVIWGYYIGPIFVGIPAFATLFGISMLLMYIVSFIVGLLANTFLQAGTGDSVFEYALYVLLIVAFVCVVLFLSIYHLLMAVNKMTTFMLEKLKINFNITETSWGGDVFRTALQTTVAQEMAMSAMDKGSVFARNVAEKGKQGSYKQIRNLKNKLNANKEKGAFTDSNEENKDNE